MRLGTIEFTTRKDGTHHFRGYQIRALKIGSGVGVVCVFEAPTQIDEDFQRALYSHEYVWTPSQKELDMIQHHIDESDYRTAKLLNVQGWDSGPRPFRLEQFV